MNLLTITDRDLESELAQLLAEQIQQEIDLEILTAMGVDISVQPEDIQIFLEKIDPTWSRIVSHIRVKDFNQLEKDTDINQHLVPGRGIKLKVKGSYLFAFPSDETAMYWKMRI